MSLKKTLLFLNACLVSFAFSMEDDNFSAFKTEFESIKTQPKEAKTAKTLTSSKWILIGRFKSPESGNKILDNEFNPEGIKDEDSRVVGLSFNKKDIKTWVEFSNYRTPSEVKISNTGVLYSILSTTTDEVDEKFCKVEDKKRVCSDSHFEYTCKLGSSSQTLICSMLFKIDSMNPSLESMKHLDGKTVAYYKYKKH